MFRNWRSEPYGTWRNNERAVLQIHTKSIHKFPLTTNNKQTRSSSSIRYQPDVNIRRIYIKPTSGVVKHRICKSQPPRSYDTTTTRCAWAPTWRNATIQQAGCSSIRIQTVWPHQESTKQDYVDARDPTQHSNVKIKMIQRIEQQIKRIMDYTATQINAKGKKKKHHPATSTTTCCKDHLISQTIRKALTQDIRSKMNPRQGQTGDVQVIKVKVKVNGWQYSYLPP